MRRRVVHGDEWHATLFGHRQPLEDRRVAEATVAQGPCARAQGAEEAVGACDIDDRGANVFGRQQLACRERLWDHRAARCDDNTRAWPAGLGLDEAIPTRQHVVAQCRAIDSFQ